MANSGIAEPAKKYAQRRSRAYSPGARNAQNWYSHSGDGEDHAGDDRDLQAEEERVEDAGDEQLAALRAAARDLDMGGAG